MFRYFVVTRLFSPRFLLVCLFVLVYRKGFWFSSCFDIQFHSTGANSPRSISLVSSVQYNPEIPCSDATTASSKLKAQLESSVSCAVNGSCSINVSTPGIYLFLIKLSILFDDAFFYSLFCWNFMTQKSCFCFFVTGCPFSGRRRRSTSSSQTITLTQTLVSGDNLNLEAFHDSQNGNTSKNTNIFTMY